MRHVSASHVPHVSDSHVPHVRVSHVCHVRGRFAVANESDLSPQRGESYCQYDRSICERKCVRFVAVNEGVIFTI